jgi:formylglycine-generating enzyme
MRPFYLALASAAAFALAVRSFGCENSKSVVLSPNRVKDAPPEASTLVDATNTALGDAQAEGSVAQGPLQCEHARVVANCNDGWCTVPAGCYIAGSPESEVGRGLSTEPEVRLTLSRSFQVGQYEVTQLDWRAVGFVDPTTRIPDKDYGVSCVADNCPLNKVSWYESLAYANALSEKNGLPTCYSLVGCTGRPGDGLDCSDFTLKDAISYECRGFRLPMVAEWEYAARAGTRTPFYGGSQSTTANRDGDCYDEPALNDIAWYCHNTYTKPGKRPNTTMPVGKLKPNDWGLFDMLGNSGEWCMDHMRGAGYGIEPLTDPGEPILHLNSHTIRGGFMVAAPNILRASNMFGGGPNSRDVGIGFRLVRTIFP